VEQQELVVYLKHQVLLVVQVLQELQVLLEQQELVVQAKLQEHLVQLVQTVLQVLLV
jgi:hypothetical protein